MNSQSSSSDDDLEDQSNLINYKIIKSIKGIKFIKEQKKKYVSKIQKELNGIEQSYSNLITGIKNHFLEISKDIQQRLAQTISDDEINVVEKLNNKVVNHFAKQEFKEIIKLKLNVKETGGKIKKWKKLVEQPQEKINLRKLEQINEIITNKMQEVQSDKIYKIITSKIDQEINIFKGNSQKQPIEQNQEQQDKEKVDINQLEALKEENVQTQQKYQQLQIDFKQRDKEIKKLGDKLQTEKQINKEQFDELLQQLNQSELDLKKYKKENSKQEKEFKQLNKRNLALKESLQKEKEQMENNFTQELALLKIYQYEKVQILQSKNQELEKKMSIELEQKILQISQLDTDNKELKILMKQVEEKDRKLLNTHNQELFKLRETISNQKVQLDKNQNVHQIYNLLEKLKNEQKICNQLEERNIQQKSYDIIEENVSIDYHQISNSKNESQVNFQYQIKKENSKQQPDFKSIKTYFIFDNLVKNLGQLLQNDGFCSFKLQYIDEDDDIIYLETQTDLDIAIGDIQNLELDKLNIVVIGSRFDDMKFKIDKNQKYKSKK